MKLALAAFGILLLLGAQAGAAVTYGNPIPLQSLVFDDDDGYSQPEGSGEGETLNPCAPATYDADQCITPE